MMGIGAQSSTEYLVIFAIVVILALVVAGVLLGFPQIGGGVGERESLAYWGSASVGITKLNVSTDPSKTTITFRNNNDYPIRLDRVLFGEQSLLIGKTLSPGANLDVNGSGVMCPVEGEKYYFNVAIYYMDVQSGTSHALIGEKPLVGICQGS